MNGIQKKMGKNLVLFVGPCGAGKSTMARKITDLDPGYVYVNQDSAG